jgi:hypothetical protein
MRSDAQHYRHRRHAQQEQIFSSNNRDGEFLCGADSDQKTNAALLAPDLDFTQVFSFYRLRSGCKNTFKG